MCSKTLSRKADEMPQPNPSASLSRQPAGSPVRVSGGTRAGKLHLRASRLARQLINEGWSSAAALFILRQAIKSVPV